MSKHENSGLNRVSMSKSALLLSPCIAWAGGGAVWYDENRVDVDELSKRDKGTLFHKMIAAGLNQIRQQWPTCPDDVWAWYEHARIYVEQVLLPRCETYQTEVCVGVNWATGEADIFDVSERNYPDKPGWQFGTADVVAVFKDTSLYIADWKTGGSDGAYEQLMSLACGFQQCMMTKPQGQEYLRNVRLACLQVNDEGVWPHESEVHSDEMNSHWTSMKFQWEDVVSGSRSKVLEPGIHCTTLYCPHLGHCSAIADVVSDMAGQAKPGTGPLVPVEALLKKVTEKVSLAERPLTDADAGASMALVSAAKRQLKYAEEQLKAYVGSGGKVVCGSYEWSQGDNGFRWRKR